MDTNKIDSFIERVIALRNNKNVSQKGTAEYKLCKKLVDLIEVYEEFEIEGDARKKFDLFLDESYDMYEKTRNFKEAVGTTGEQKKIRVVH
jgi:hypothetical protein